MIIQNYYFFASLVLKRYNTYFSKDMVPGMVHLFREREYSLKRK